MNDTFVINSCTQRANTNTQDTGARDGADETRAEQATQSGSQTNTWRSLTSTSEGEMARNRLVIALLIFSYFLIEWGVNGHFLATPVLTITTFAAFSFGIAYHILRHPEANYVRRIVAMCADIGTLSFGLYIGGEITACTWPVYLWVIYGNGFRFGQMYLAVSTLIAAACFLAVISFTPYWNNFYNLSLGLLVGLIILPTYARKLINDLSEARRRAEDGNRAKSLFLASVSHELRTPLNAIIGLGDCVQATRLDNNQSEMLSTICRSGRTLSHLIENLLDFSRLESGAMPCNFKEVQLPSLVADVCSIAKAQAAAKGVKFNLHVEPTVPACISADATKLTQILTNFVSNAVKFTDEGVVTLTISSRNIDKNFPALRFEVTDTGIGISSEAQERIFERFTQENEKIVDRYGGTGLGLAIVKQTAALLGGKVGVKSAQGKGSTFWCEIPVPEIFETVTSPDETRSDVIFFLSEKNANRTRQSLKVRPNITFVETAEDLESLLEEPQSARTEKIIFTDNRKHAAVIALLQEHSDRMTHVVYVSNSYTRSAHEVETIQQTCISWINFDRLSVHFEPIVGWIEAIGRQKKKVEAITKRQVTPASILVAEDNPANQLVIQKILSNAGHDFVIVNDGECVVDALAKKQFDIILLDINMPVMNGFETIKFIRFALHDQDTPVVAVTADATPETAERCREAGFDTVVTKPYRAHALLQTIEEFVVDLEGGSNIASQEDSSPDTLNVISHDAPAGKDNSPTVIDLEQLQEVEALGGVDFVENVVHTFLSQCRRTLVDLRFCAEKKYDDEVSHIAHALKSSALNSGATKVAALCEQLEEKTESSCRSWVETTIDELQSAVDECGPALLEYLELHPDKSHFKQSISRH